ncbi:universal stress protein [Chelatococcus sambhunathii]|uniref:Universal stress protein n=1 Tax=Chelatococcus sambhunathii TaxID=363953 RepID=A0ABU1DGV5_9HYPH|nr:universal stress protein [Chelatococcus sambhunathii]MDR4307273.1 universal stress protein [Chelatococcus sambhunathii]
MSARKPDASGFASIMAHLDLGPWAEARGRLAASLADEFGARLIGVAAEQLIAPIYSDGLPNVAEEVTDEERLRASGDLAAAKRAFEAAAGGRNDVEWRSAFAHPERFLIEQARAADLIVVGRWATYDERDPNLGVSPAAVAMECGRPILVIPPEKDYLAARTIVVAWKDTREARRAVRDALPFLKRAHEVHVVAVTSAPSDEGAEDVCAWLAGHGVNCRPSIRAGETTSIADELSDLSVEMGADLIVSGAYGHSRMREWFFGGATRDLLETSRACLLMSH